MNIIGISLLIGAFSVILILYLLQEFVSYRKVLKHYKNAIEDLEGEIRTLEKKVEKVTKPEK